jgi:tetratricopeptide (TPR) repeat protein
MNPRAAEGGRTIAMAQTTLSLILMTGTVAALAGAAAGYLSAPKQAAGAADGSAAALESLRGELARLGQGQTSLERALEELRAGSELVAPAAASLGARVAPSEIDAAVARWMAERAPESSAAASASGEQVSPEERVAEALARFDAEELSDLEWQALWRELAEEGLTDELVAAFEARAAAAPNDPDAQVALAGAYLGKILEVGNSPEAGMWATRADESLDRALAIDDHHWDARFTKAMSLSFWPPVFGKQGEAIRQFEILVEQQAGLAPDERYAQTHLLLGNMYRQIGEEERALSAWRLGLELYPDHEDLASQLEVFAGAE